MPSVAFIVTLSTNLIMYKRVWFKIVFVRGNVFILHNIKKKGINKMVDMIKKKIVITTKFIS